MLEIML